MPPATRFRRGIAAGLISVVLILSLAGCFLAEPPQRDPISIQRSGSTLLIAVCEGYALEHIYLQQRAAGSQSEVVWDDFANISMVAGRPYSVADLALTGGQPQEPLLSSGTQLKVQLLSEDAAPLVADFVVPESGLSVDGWLQPDGSTLPSACPE